MKGYKSKNPRHHAEDFPSQKTNIMKNKPLLLHKKILVITTNIFLP
jgi:hypothetical protein